MTKKFVTRNSLSDHICVNKYDALALLVHIGWLVPVTTAKAGFDFELTPTGRKHVSPASLSAGGRGIEYDLEALKAAIEKHVKPATAGVDHRKVIPDQLPDKFVTRGKLVDALKIGSITLTNKLEKAGLTEWDPLYRTQGGMVPTKKADGIAQLNSKGHYEWNPRKTYAALAEAGVL